MDNRLQEQIDNYHSGRMTPDEMAAFESNLSSDPSLKAESDLQGEIVNGLKEFRKDQLKARMDAIDLGPSWVEFAQQSTLMKSFGGIAVATLIGTGVYFYGEKPEDLVDRDPVVIDAPKVENLEYVFELSNEKPQESIAEEARELTPIKEIKEEVANNAMETKPAEQFAEQVEKAFNPSFDAPDANNISDEEALQTSGLDELPDESPAEVNETPINVETEITKNIKVKYKYYDGKLFLSGDFDRAPYEILEINSASGRRIYVKYLNKYYKVGITDQLSDLPEVTDSEVIAELDLLRQNK